MTPDELISLVFSPDASLMDEQYSHDTIYKYVTFPNEEFREKYLRNPTVKFTQKTDLNDPFELTKRWKEFGSKPTLDAFNIYVRDYIEEKACDTNYLLDEITKDIRFISLGVSRDDLKNKLESSEGRMLLEALRANAITQIAPFISAAFSAMEDQSDEMIERVIRTTGILSLTEVATNRALWSLYANSGNGFVLEFDAQNDFFISRKDGVRRNKLKKVFYRDDRLEDFWKNPNYLFCVKNSEFSFEREWRMVRKIDDCEKIEIPGRSPLYTLRATDGLIKSIIFGYNYNSDKMKRESEIIKKFDGKIAVKNAVVDVQSGELVIRDFHS